jgi:hypothetical protein
VEGFASSCAMPTTHGQDQERLSYLTPGEMGLRAKGANYRKL